MNGTALAANNLSNGTTGSGAVALQTNPVLGHPQINTGIVNSGSGMMHVRAGSCTTAAATFAACNTTITWPGTWPDTNYTAICTADNTGAGGVASVLVISGKSTTQMGVTIQNANSNGNATSVTLNCIGMHD